MLLLGTFLFNLLCGLVPCDPSFQKPEVRMTPSDPRDILKNIEKRNVEPIVSIKNGIIEGYKMKSMNGRDIFAFEGIPYAENTANHRWKPPVPKRPWRNVLHAKKTGPDCLQISLPKLLRVYGSEDCLFVNVYTPNLPHSHQEIAEYPVVVYIHGGSFLMGAGSEHGPSYMLNEDVVLVTINYRLGVLGFLSTGDSVIPGNYGLKDQALAIKWVHDNIQNFGGNPKNVSLWGNSAGGVSVHLQMISNKTRDYFTTGFCSSATAFQDWAVQSRERMLYLANRLAKRFNCQNPDSRALAECLKRVEVNSLVAAQLNLFDWFPFPPVLFSPTVEPEHPDAIVTIHPEEAYKQNLVPKTPMIMSLTKDEGQTAMMILMMFVKTLPLRVMWKQIAPVFLNYRDFTKNPAEITSLIEKFYLEGKPPQIESRNILSDMVTDRYLAFGIVKGIQAHSWYQAPTYAYYFSFSEGNHNFGNTIGLTSQEWGAGHTEDIFYLFNNSIIYDGQKHSDPDHELSSIMINMLVNFARTGKPLYRTGTDELVSIWEPVQNFSHINMLQLDRKVEQISLPTVKRMNFWNDLNVTGLSLWSKLF